MAKKSIKKIFFFLFVFILTFSVSVSALQLELHDRGLKVVEVQIYLNELGYNLDADGIFGITTENAVKGFQEDNNLHVDGIVGENSYQLLKKMISEKVSYELYVVDRGDTLSGIAKKRDVSISKIKEFNNLSSDRIKVGQDLKIPRKEAKADSNSTNTSSSSKNGRTEKIYYTVRPGDTISEIAAKRNLTVEEIINENNLNSDFIKAGQEIVLPIVNYKQDKSDTAQKVQSSVQQQSSTNTFVYEVKRGDALSTIARMYGTDVDTLRRKNDISGDRIFVGQELLIDDTGKGPFRLERNAFIWPVRGRLTSGFGWRNHPIKKTRLFHNGLDIAVPTGTKIKAAASGKVVHSGWMNGFGYTVIIDHGMGIETLYGHNSRVLVRRGVNVHKGQNIALSGNTGLSTGPHLHFGVLRNEKPLNPMNYLP